MRTATKSGITLKYPDDLGFAFNPCLLVAEGTEYMIVNITDGVTVQNVTYRGINGNTFADIRSWVQSFFDENTFEQLNYAQSLQQVATGKRLSVVVTVRGTYEIQKNYPLHRSHVYIDLAEVLDAAEVRQTKTAVLGDKVRDIMLKNLRGEAK